MFIINTNFSTNPELAIPHSLPHKEWVKKYVNNGVFIFAGPRTDGDGGIIVADGIDIDQLKNILNEDPFVIFNLIVFDIKEFNPVFKK